jgi:hypothetical protein
MSRFTQVLIEQVSKIAKRERCSLKTPTGQGRLLDIINRQSKYRRQVGNLSENDIKIIAKKINNNH